MKDSFWFWMEQKDYGYMSETGQELVHTGFGTGASMTVAPTKQMLIGYLVEYLNSQQTKSDENGFKSMEQFFEVLTGCVKKEGEKEK